MSASVPPRRARLLMEAAALREDHKTLLNLGIHHEQNDRSGSVLKL